jgi:hypothetical protein
MEIHTVAPFDSPRRRSQPPRGRRRRSVRPELRPLEQRSLLSGYQQINLVGYQSGMAPQTDPNLNGWGIDMFDGGFESLGSFTDVHQGESHKTNREAGLGA